MKILYVHGLESKLNPDKRKILEKYGSVLAPDIDYRSDQNVIQTLNEEYSNQEIDVIIGSSIGGFTAFYLAQLLQKPTLVFNPALAKRSVVQNVPDAIAPHFAAVLKVVLGQKDTVVSPTETMQFLKSNYSDETRIIIEMNSMLEHQIPIEIFTKEVQHFFKIDLQR